MAIEIYDAIIIRKPTAIYEPPAPPTEIIFKNILIKIKVKKLTTELIVESVPKNILIKTKIKKSTIDLIVESIPKNILIKTKINKFLLEIPITDFIPKNILVKTKIKKYLLEIPIIDFISKDLLLKIKIKKLLVYSVFIVTPKKILIRIKIKKFTVTKSQLIISKNIKIKIKFTKGIFYEIPFMINKHMKIRILFKKTPIEGGQIYNLPSKSAGGVGFVWGGNKKVDIKTDSLWEVATKKDNEVLVKYEGFEKKDEDLKSPWSGIVIKVDDEIKIPWGDFQIKQNIDIIIPYENILNFMDNKMRIPWRGNFENENEKQTNIAYLHPEKKDTKANIPWGGRFPLKIDMLFNVSYNIPEKKDIKHETHWGPYWYAYWCQRKYFPPTFPLTIKFDENETIGDASVISFMDIISQKCPYQKPYSGPRDSNLPLVKIYRLLPRKDFYIVNNVVLVKRIPDNTPIDILNLSISIDVNSWLWNFSLSVPHKNYVDLLKPQSSGDFREIEININGFIWKCLIQSWSESKSFGKTTWSLSGVSPSIELSSNFSPLSSYKNNSNIQGGQIIDEILEYTDWVSEWPPGALNWSDWLNPYTDWNIPAGVFSYIDKAPIEAIQEIVNACGAYLQTDMSLKKLIVLPRYKVSPLKWSDPLYEVQLEIININDSICLEIGQSNSFKPERNAIYVSGQNQGTGVDVIIGGTAGNLQAPMITNSLITTSNVGHGLARKVLGESGKWINKNLKIFSLIADSPGLLLPGTMIKMNEISEEWIGQVISINISVEAMKENTGNVVWQTIGVEQYYG